jgi:hypothetical protein
MTLSAMSTTSSGLDIVPLLAPASTRDGFPSWSPNWFDFDDKHFPHCTEYLLGKKLYYHPVHSYWPQEHTYHRHETTKSMPSRFSVSGDVLKVEGLLLGDVRSFLANKPDANGEFCVVSHCSSSQAVSRPNPYGTTRNMLEAFDDSLDFDIYPRHRRNRSLWAALAGWERYGYDTKPTLATETSWAWVQAMRTFQLRGQSLDHWANSTRSQLLPIIARKMSLELLDVLSSIQQSAFTYISTESGYVGWSTRAVELYDAVFLISGCSVPVVLRKRENGGYTVVGDAYVQGVMRGERSQYVGSSFSLLQRDGALVGSQPEDWTELEIH